MKNSAIPLLILLLILLIIVIGYRYDQYVVNKNFLINVNTVCDVNTESCFTADCQEDDLECDSTPYIKIEILASEAPKCLEEHNCSSFSCSSADNCSVISCNEDILEDGEKCAVK